MFSTSISEKISNKPTQTVVVALGIGIAVGVCGTLVILRVFSPEVTAPFTPGKALSSTEVRGGGYTFINPLLECEVLPENGFSSLQPATNAIKNSIATFQDTGIVTNVAVYFRDLNNGPWFGINEHELFAPASLYKVPLMIAILKEAESNPEVLQKKIRYVHEQLGGELVQNFDPDTPLQPGKEYTVEELLGHMIQQSDNEALGLLVDVVTEEQQKQTEADLGLQLEINEWGEDAITVKSYAGIFRILYNASYLNREMSEKALSILSGSKFTQGIPGGLPEGITVSHKFGERVLENLDGTYIKQLHDCGIVYYSDTPYLLCVMTRGYDLQQQTSLVREISRVIYQDIQLVD